MEFMCLSIIIISFSEVPGVDGSDGGRLVLRLRLTRIKKKAVENPNILFPREINLENTILDKFDTNEYGATFIAYLIESFDYQKFDFLISTEVLASTDDSNHENDLMGEFMSKFYEITKNSKSKVPLSLGSMNGVELGLAL
jgi:hypothetical protein